MHQGVDDLALALELADIADTIVMRRYRATNLEVDTKPDLTPVTESDRRSNSRSASASPRSARGTR